MKPYRLMVFSPGIMVDQRFETYEEAQVLSDYYLESLKGCASTYISVLGPDRDNADEQIRYWSYEVR